MNGIHNVTDLDLDGHSDICEKNGFTNINIKCSGTDIIEFYKECPNGKKLKIIEITSSNINHCLGGWQQHMPISELIRIIQDFD